MDYHNAITIRNLEKYIEWRILREDFNLKRKRHERAICSVDLPFERD